MVCKQGNSLHLFTLFVLVLVFPGYAPGLPVETNKDRFATAVDQIVVQEKSGKLKLASDDGVVTNAVENHVDIPNKGIVSEDGDREKTYLDTGGDLSGQAPGLFGGGDSYFDPNQTQNDAGQGYEEPTVRIVVSVMKRARRYWEPWELNRDVCPPSICLSNDEGGRPRGTGGSVFYNGDIVLDKESETIIFPEGLNSRWGQLLIRRRRATMKSSRLWKHGVVPYVFADNIERKAKSVIRKAMKEIQNKTCITFRRRKLRDEDYVRFISEPGCWSSVGRVGGEQKISIGRGCERIGTAIHEISHSLGFWHEQARPDRNSYVKILEENVSPRYLPDFQVASAELVTSRGYPYDYESIMHYSNKAFTNVGKSTIKVIGIGRKLKLQIGQRDELSNLDIAQLRDMYNCNDKEDDEVTFCPKDWVKNGRNCYRFEPEMREQFSGAAKHCEDMNSKLLHIGDAKEDAFVKRLAKKKYPDVKVWRTGGRVINGTFVWYNGPESNARPMTYTNWQKGHPAASTSMALVYNRQKDRVRWQGVWLGSYKQLPDHAYAFICERRARRKCIAGQYADGRDYRGQLDHTIDGLTCQKWSSQYPHAHDLLPHPFNATKDDRDGLGEHNYCRNPSGNRRSRPWCYTTKKKVTWQYCDISICSKSLQNDQGRNQKGNNRRGSTDNRTERILDTGNRRGRDRNSDNRNKDTAKDNFSNFGDKTNVDKKERRNKKDKTTDSRSNSNNGDGGRRDGERTNQGSGSTRENKNSKNRKTGSRNSEDRGNKSNKDRDQRRRGSNNADRRQGTKSGGNSRTSRNRNRRNRESTRTNR